MVFHIKYTVLSSNLIAVQCPRLNTNPKNTVKEKRILISRMCLHNLSIERLSIIEGLRERTE